MKLAVFGMILAVICLNSLASAKPIDDNEVKDSGEGIIVVKRAAANGIRVSVGNAATKPNGTVRA